MSPPLSRDEDSSPRRTSAAADVPSTAAIDQQRQLRQRLLRLIVKNEDTRQLLRTKALP